MFIPFLSRKPLLNPVEQKQIIAAIQAAEQRTSGEIRVFVESRCRFVDPLDRATEVFAALKMEKSRRFGINWAHFFRRTTMALTLLLREYAPALSQEIRNR